MEKRKPTIRNTSNIVGGITLNCYCRVCTKTKSAKSNFYVAKNKEIDKNGYMSICRDCCGQTYINFYNKLKDVPRAIYSTCQLLDIVYLEEQVKSSLTHYNSLVERGMVDAEFNLFSYYIGKLSNIENCSFKDSDNLIVEGSDKKIEESETTFDREKELKKIWGDFYEPWEYEYLSNQFSLISSNVENSFSMDMIIRDICHYNLEIEKGRKTGNKDIVKLIKARQELMEDAKMKPKQVESIDSDGNITLGTLAEMWENERPVDKWPEDSMVQSMRYFIAQLARMEGHDNPLTDQMLKELEEYSVDPKSFITNGDDNNDILGLGEDYVEAED